MNTILLALCVFLPLLTAPVIYAVCKKSYAFANTLLRVVTFAVFAITLCLVFAREAPSLTLESFSVLSLSFSFAGFRAVLSTLCAFAFMISVFSSRFYFENSAENPRYFAFTMLTMSGTMGVFLSGDLFTTYLFFEIMSLSSWVWVAQTETDQAARVSRSYLAYSIIGGLALLLGIVFVSQATGGVLAFDKLLKAVNALSDKSLLVTGGIFLFTGFGIKAGAFPLHTWLPEAHPIAPAPSSALLSGILTKAGVFGLIISATQLFWGSTEYALLLMASGTITMLLGALVALFTTNLKKALAGSSLSQIGFILVGLSMLTLAKDTAYAAGGVMLHIINHTLIKLVLFISAGAFYKNYHTLNLNKLRGTGRSNKFVAVCFMVASLAISGIPFLSGYVSKTLIHEAIVENMHIASGSLHNYLAVLEILFIVAGGFTLAYMTKLVYKLFIQKPLSAQTKPLKIDFGTRLAIVIPSTLLVLCGIFPSVTYEKIANFCAPSLMSSTFHAHYFAFANIKGALYSILAGIAIFFIVVRLLLMDKKGEVKKLKLPSLEKHLYAPVLSLLSFIGALIARVLYSVVDFIIHIISLIVFFRDPEYIPTDTDDHFGRYTKKYVRAGRISQTLAFELMLCGTGVAIILIYLLVS